MIPVEISNRHLHISKEDYEKLFDKELTKLRNLSQEGEFAANETVELNGFNVRIIGSFRECSQLELSKTDARIIKLNLPLNLSGDLTNAPLIEVKTNKGTVRIPAIIAKRHLHCNENKAKELGLKNNEIISLKVMGLRPITFHDVVVRVKKDFNLVFHLDTDEGNAAGVNKNTEAFLVEK